MLNQTTAGMTGVMSGNYGIFNCGTNATGIVTLLETLRSTLEEVLQDLDSRRSSRAFNTFFKDIRNAPYVRQVIQNITSDSPTSVIDTGHRNFPGFVCATAPRQVWWTSGDGEETDAYDRCLQHDRVAASSILSTADFPLIVLCPYFFEWPAIPPISKHSCSKVDSQSNAFADNGLGMIVFQMWAVMHELVHMYIYWSSGAELDLYDINQCLHLPESETVQNAQNYAFYAASQSEFSRTEIRDKNLLANPMVDIRLGCRVFPDVQSRRFPDVEFLEIEANSTSKSTSDGRNLTIEGLAVSGQAGGNLTIVDYPYPPR